MIIKGVRSGEKMDMEKWLEIKRTIVESVRFYFSITVWTLDN